MLEALELVQDDQVGLQRVHADLRKLVTQRTDKAPPVSQVALGPMLPQPAEPLPEIVELFAKAGLATSACEPIMVFDCFRETTNELPIHWFHAHIAQVPAKALVSGDGALKDSPRSYTAERLSSPGLSKQQMKESSLTRDSICRFELERRARSE
jgi:hypothetical protein